MRKVTEEEWRKEGAVLFGPDTDKWMFKCPSCGNIQCTDDFRRYKDKGAMPSDSYFNCIGRFTGTENEIFSEEQPCNYTLGGLFCFVKTIVIDTKGKEHRVFEFAKGDEGNGNGMVQQEKKASQ